MTEKKHFVKVYFDDEELAVLKELSAGTKWSRTGDIAISSFASG